MRRGGLRRVRSGLISFLTVWLAVVLIGSAATLIPALAAGIDQNREIEWADAPPPPPVLSDALREPPVAKIQPRGVLDPPISDIKIEGDPTEILDGLNEDVSARTEFRVPGDRQQDAAVRRGRWQ